MSEKNLYSQVIWNCIKCPDTSWAFSTGIKMELCPKLTFDHQEGSVTVCPVQLTSVSETPQEPVERTSVKGMYKEHAWHPAEDHLFLLHNLQTNQFFFITPCHQFLWQNYIFKSETCNVCWFLVSSRTLVWTTPSKSGFSPKKKDDSLVRSQVYSFRVHSSGLSLDWGTRQTCSKVRKELMFFETELKNEKLKSMIQGAFWKLLCCISP